MSRLQDMELLNRIQMTSRKRSAVSIKLLRRSDFAIFSFLITFKHSGKLCNANAEVFVLIPHLKNLPMKCSAQFAALGAVGEIQA